MKKFLKFEQSILNLEIRINFGLLEDSEPLSI